MNSTITSGPLSRQLRLLACLLGITLGTLAATVAQAQPTIVSTVPAMMATGVSPSAAVVITFSEAMDPEQTTIEFFDVTNPFGEPLKTTVSWSAGNTKLSATPNPPFPPNKMIAWSVDGSNPNGDFLEGETGGMFTTGSGGGGGETGYGTNAYTGFSVGVVHYYHQASNAVPVLDPEIGYGFFGGVSLASNRPASDAFMRMPTGVTTNLAQSSQHPEDWAYFTWEPSTNLAGFNAMFPAGSYAFTVKSSQPDLQASATLQAVNLQPNAPQITSYPALTGTDVSQPITVTWTPFQTGTAADYIHVDIWATTRSTNVFSTGDFGTTNVLPGTATSVVVPGGTLLPDQDHSITVTFYRWTVTTNAANAWAAVGYRATGTDLEFHTKAGGLVPPGNVSMSAPRWTGNAFTFTITGPPGRPVTVESSTTLQPGSWTTLQTLNNPTGTVQCTDPVSSNAGGKFYRVRL